MSGGAIVLAPLAGVVRPLAQVPDAVFASGMMGPGLAIDPTGDTLHAPIDGLVASIHAARHALTIEAVNGAKLLLHLGIDTVALGGAGIQLLVAEGMRVTAGTPLLRFDLDRLVREATAIVTPVIATGNGNRIEALATGMVTVGMPLFRLVQGDDAPVVETADGEGSSRRVAVRLPHGIHARPAATIGAAARTAGAAVTLIHGDRRAPANSVTALLGLGAACGSVVTIEAKGERAVEAIEAIAAVLQDATPETAAAPPPLIITGGSPGEPGIAAAPGVAIGPSICWQRPVAQPIEATGEPAFEARRLADALDAVRATLAAGAAADGARGAVIAAHGAMLDDPVLLDAAQASIAAGRSASVAYTVAIAEQAALLTGSGDARIAGRVDDLRDLEARVLAALAGGGPAAPSDVRGAIVIADELLPSDVLALADAGAAGFALAGGGPTSHAAILAAGAGVPMLVALGTTLAGVTDGTMLILDADHGRVEVDPPADRLTEVEAEDARRRAEAQRSADGPCRTVDGARIELFANLGSRADAEAAVAAGAEGCGLLRTEFLFLDRATPPDEAEQRAAYTAIAGVLGDRPLVLRLLDVGGDKPAPYLNLPAEDNPALGVRGVRVSLADPALLDTQLAAAIATGCRIMVPMVASVGELDMVIARAEALGGAAASIGVMVETPAAAMTADLLASRAAFLSIGTNDLTQYALAMDRGNPAVAGGIDGLHPAVLRLIAQTCAGAARHARPVGVCGGLAADVLAVPILLGLGVTELSVPPSRLAAIRAVVRRLDLRTARDHARAMLDQPSAAAVRAAAACFAGEMR
ncbi:phosphoenolpyruvate--protein phosphotransferase [Sphingomonas sp. KR1UV-12]|uniref:phosphoenolpyruvate--protein phosphotransferase n=1 Tax=Sphingomonas aurea TaxID=3063994 RepID=A0ABT9EL04_9SPHN|nr:phosphoenolpyruvate--protein phosphotransferase [Sphingomonas sp. KR1UV-12]MDP1027641.1 phosphoenolpyruvate--protein phosphotransferase [Sphingomonas sp. KR1UV-12]